MPSKFVEHLDISDVPFSDANVSLEDILEDKRHRSGSQGSFATSPTDKSVASSQGFGGYDQREASTSSGASSNSNNDKNKNKFRRFSLMIKK